MCDASIQSDAEFMAVEDLRGAGTMRAIPLTLSTNLCADVDDFWG